MIVILIMGILCFPLGLYAVIKGKFPILKKYEGVKNVSRYSRIGGISLILISTLCITFYFFEFPVYVWIIAAAIIPPFTLTAIISSGSV